MLAAIKNKNNKHKQQQQKQINKRKEQNSKLLTLKQFPFLKECKNYLKTEKIASLYGVRELNALLVHLQRRLEYLEASLLRGIENST